MKIELFTQLMKTLFWRRVMFSSCRDYLRVNPPSTARTCPVIKDASWLSRNTIVAATSSGAPIRLITERSVVQLGSSPVLVLSGVSIRPGATALILTRGSLSFRANDFVEEIYQLL